MEKIIKKERLIELIQHEDENVKFNVFEALKDHYHESKDIAPYFIKLIKESLYDKNLYMQESTDIRDIIHNLQYFDIDEKEYVFDILNMFNDIKNRKSFFFIDFQFCLLLTLNNVPFKILDECISELNFNKDYIEVLFLDKKITVSETSKKDFETLWNELLDLCEKYESIEEFLDEMLFFHTLFLNDKEKLKSKVLDYLNQEDKDNEILKINMIMFADKLKLTEYIPFLLNILITNDIESEICQFTFKALINIDNIEIVDKIKQDYDKLDNSNKVPYIELLGKLPYKSAEDFIFEKLIEENDIATKTLLAISLCNLFSKKSIKYIKDMIKQRQYDTSITNLYNNLYSVYVYHDIDEDLRMLKEIADDYENEFYENELYESEYYDEDYDDEDDDEDYDDEDDDEDYDDEDYDDEDYDDEDYDDEDDDEEYNNFASNDSENKKIINTNKIGRNDPCPCGSGKKYKKCCGKK